MSITRKKDKNKFLTVPGFLMEKMETLSANREKYSMGLLTVICPIMTFYLFDFYTHNPFTTMTFKIQVLNMVFYECVALALIGMFKGVRTALMLQSVFFMIVGLANYYVLSFRSAPIRPWDIFSWKTAASVANNYSYVPEKGTVMILICFVLLLVLEGKVKTRVDLQWWKRLLLVSASIALLAGYTGLVQNQKFVSKIGLYDKLFTPTVVNKKDGNAVAFLMELKYIKVEKPSGYSTQKMKELYQQEGQDSQGLQQALDNPESVKRPNIIVIMNEAFSDLSVLGEVGASEDYMPFIHSLRQGADNTETGYLNVSVLGGNTANTEFEFLTGNTLAFLPQGSVAYQQYLQNKMPSLASYLKDLGYSTVAMHPYYPNGWDRSRVYPLMGFDTFLSKDDFLGADILRKYVTDQSCFDKIIDLYEEKDASDPLFVFNVTMQNHSGYDDQYDNFTPDIKVDGSSSKALSAYLSLIKESDSAFEKLIQYFSEADEDTIIVMFGDHQPTTYVSNPVLRRNGKDPNELSQEEDLLHYKVPYVIWSNFDIPEKTEGETSANYLMIDVLEDCGLPLPAYQSSLKKLREKYPIISAVQVQDDAGRIYTAEELKDELETYQSLEYYLLYDYTDEN